MDSLITGLMYLGLAVLVLGFISGALFYGFGTPVRAGISIVFLILLYRFMFKSSLDTENIMVYLIIATFVLYNLKQLGVLSIFLLLISSNSDYVSKSYSSPVTEKEKACQTYYVNTDILNLRKAPSVNSEKIDFLKKGTEVCVSKREGNWSYIDDQGWVAYKYLTTKEP